jgi:hypothetical protein
MLCRQMHMQCMHACICVICACGAIPRGVRFVIATQLHSNTCNELALVKRHHVSGSRR